MALVNRLYEAWLKKSLNSIPQQPDTYRMIYSDPETYPRWRDSLTPLFRDFGVDRLKAACGCSPSCTIIWQPNADPLRRVGEFVHTDGKHGSRLSVTHEVLKYGYDGTISALMEHLVRQCQNDHQVWSRRKRYVRTWGEDER